MKQAEKKYCPRVKRFKGALSSFVLISIIALVSPVVGVTATTTVAAVNQTPIFSRAVDGALRAYLSSIGHRELPASRMRSLREGILKRLIEEELLYQEALKEGLTVTENEIDAGVAKIRSRFQSDRSYELALEKKVLGPKDIRAGVKRAILINKTWFHLSTLTQTERKLRLKAISENADIKINVSQVNVNPVDRVISGE